ncbi:hypothetical protein FHS04_002824 [Mesoflavibacter sabulilitoris]|uniref:Uncharacterized protein n=1 Tax=Mesoflavibacter zeaxanthinifaciens subsp. sabulilitoris TaxID=1520893 RepID=A0A2T1NNQ5_9FLAO|nr:hypothetical protein [Mesoflavibacter zeaxanthinifaciens]MBB3125280.1 hypothetical protein [Mesoflavibacter zeaxanthinifaciens subsp. sabulilitoris]PSG94516.1 hypothetical protein C7H61_00855 [Mesoflavibacter zeaxanthinifaciens subsp. sabulilitoris]
MNIENSKLKDFRNYIYHKSIEFGEDLMPVDVVQIILKANRSGKFKYILNTTYYLWTFELLIDVYESCGFSFPEEHKLICIDNHDEYFK